MGSNCNVPVENISNKQKTLDCDSKKINYVDHKGYCDITTPTHSKENKELNTEEKEHLTRVDETPSKVIPLRKRKSLMRDMKWEEGLSEQEVAKKKHPMEMRSRKPLRRPPYYDYEEYDDLDITFLLDEALPEIHSRSRRNKARKRKLPNKSEVTEDSPVNIPQTPTSKISHTVSSKEPTSYTFSMSRPNKKLSPLFKSDLTKCNNFETSDVEAIDAGTCPNLFTISLEKFDSNPDKNCDTTDDCLRNKLPRRKRRNSMEKLEVEIPKKHRKSGEILPEKEKNNRRRNRTINDLKSQSDLKYNQRKTNLERKRQDPGVDKKLGFGTTFPKSHCDVNNGNNRPTVTRMSLRRRHSSPLVSTFQKVENEQSSPKNPIKRTVSSPAGLINSPNCQKDTNKADKSNNEEFSSSFESQGHTDDLDSCGDVSDSDQFVDSPDSGFVSESSSSAASPGGGPANGFFDSPSKNMNVKPEVDCDVIKDPISRTVSTDSGIQVTDGLLHHKEPVMTKQSQEGEDEIRLVLCQKSVREAQRIKEEEKKKEEEAALREKFRCKWKACPSPHENRSSSDLHEHLQKYHVSYKKSEKYCCQWQGCKLFETHCRKLSWLQRHIGEHSGEKPYKCLFDGCEASFSSTDSWKRHVESHYSKVSLPKARVGGEHGPISRFLLNSRRVQNKKKTLANRQDCIDHRTIGYIKSALIENEILTETDSVGNSSDVVFKPEVLARKTGPNGSKMALVRWHPTDLLPDEWIPASDLGKERSIKRSALPWTAKSCLKKLFFFGKRSTCRKPPTLQKPRLFANI